MKPRELIGVDFETSKLDEKKWWTSSYKNIPNNPSQSVPPPGNQIFNHMFVFSKINLIAIIRHHNQENLEKSLLDT